MTVVATEKWVLPVTHLSASSLSKFAECPRRWQQRYLLKREETPAGAIVFGRGLHAALEHNLTAKIESAEDLPVEDVVTFFQDYAWPHEVARVGGAEEIDWSKEISYDHCLDLGSRMVRAYQEFAAPRVEPVAVEQRFEIELGLPVPVIGFIDVVQAAPRPLIDLKSVSRKPSGPRPDWLLQGRIYQLAYQGRALDWHAVTKQAAPLIWTGLDIPELLLEPTEPAPTVALIRQLAAMANHFMTILGPDEDWPALGAIVSEWRCGFCSFRSDCPVWQ